MDPGTGRSRPTTLPVQMQRMVAELTDQTDWYDSDAATLTPSRDPPDTPGAGNTIDLTTPSPGTAPTASLPTTLGDWFRDTSFSSHAHRMDGMQQTPPPRQQRDSPLSAATLSRYHVLMESTVDTMTEHARALEDAAMERHQLRMERSQETLRAAMHDTVAQIKRDTVSAQVTHIRGATSVISK